MPRALIDSLRASPDEIPAELDLTSHLHTADLSPRWIEDLDLRMRSVLRSVPHCAVPDALKRLAHPALILVIEPRHSVDSRVRLLLRQKNSVGRDAIQPRPVFT